MKLEPVFNQKSYFENSRKSDLFRELLSISSKLDEEIYRNKIPVEGTDDFDCSIIKEELELIEQMHVEKEWKFLLNLFMSFQEIGSDLMRLNTYFTNFILNFRNSKQKVESSLSKVNEVQYLTKVKLDLLSKVNHENQRRKAAIKQVESMISGMSEKLENWRKEEAAQRLSFEKSLDSAPCYLKEILSKDDLPVFKITSISSEDEDKK
jgi:hypothetical protein